MILHLVHRYIYKVFGECIIVNMTHVGHPCTVSLLGNVTQKHPQTGPSDHNNQNLLLVLLTFKAVNTSVQNCSKL